MEHTITTAQHQTHYQQVNYLHSKTTIPAVGQRCSIVVIGKDWIHMAIVALDILFDLHVFSLF